MAELKRLRKFIKPRAAKRQYLEQKEILKRFAKTNVNPFTGLNVLDDTWSATRVMKLLLTRVLKAEEIYNEALRNERVNRRSRGKRRVQ